jgi:hypothetical protein
MLLLLCCLQACPSSTIYKFNYGGTQLYESPVVSPPGSTTSSLCMPEFAQVENANWKLGSSGGMEVVAASNLQACVEACRSHASGACQFATFDYNADDEGNCKLRLPGGTSGT